ncbi:hypothetical protein MLD38_031522 [Melastoma candidum]|uniref:Uncharacterized protein n=1 Tax=Melastoma candidum TaxID=119954 RepID=A0ACB9MS00_9MYRT|nr:hypothetical protein MLD38_031522 [Melastoma candidum]
MGNAGQARRVSPSLMPYCCLPRPRAERSRDENSKCLLLLLRKEAEVLVGSELARRGSFYEQNLPWLLAVRRLLFDRRPGLKLLSDMHGGKMLLIVSAGKGKHFHSRNPTQEIGKSLAQVTSLSKVLPAYNAKLSNLDLGKNDARLL